MNIALSQFGTEFIRDFHARVEVDGHAPDVGFRETGYLFLATEAGNLEYVRKRKESLRID